MGTHLKQTKVVSILESHEMIGAAVAGAMEPNHQLETRNRLYPVRKTPYSVTHRGEFRHLETGRGGAPPDRSTSGEGFEGERNTYVASHRYTR